MSFVCRSLLEAIFWLGFNLWWIYMKKILGVSYFENGCGPGWRHNYHGQQNMKVGILKNKLFQLIEHTKTIKKYQRTIFWKCTVRKLQGFLFLTIQGVIAYKKTWCFYEQLWVTFFLVHPLVTQLLHFILSKTTSQYTQFVVYKIF